MKELNVQGAINGAIALTAASAAIFPASAAIAQSGSLRPVLMPELAEVSQAAQHSNPETMPTDTVSFEHDLWYFTSYTDDAGETISVETFVQPPSIRFSEGQVGGNATCNRFFGSYSLDGDSLTIQPGGSTLMACPDEFMSQEQTFLSALGQVEGYAIANDTLQLFNAEGDILLTFNKGVPPALTGTLWQLSAYNTDPGNNQGAIVSTLPGTAITATFDENGGLTGFAGCNNYIANYDATADTINIGSGVSTRKFCGQPEGLMSQESAYLQALEMADTYSLEGNTLILTTSEGATVARFRAAGGSEDF